MSASTQSSQAAMNVQPASKSSLFKKAAAGAIAGLGGGIVFGMMMAMMGMLPMVAALVRSDNAIVGFMLHMVISASIGAFYGVAAAGLPAGWVPALLGGMVNGVVWWVLGALVLMPLMLGMTAMILVIGTGQWYSLMGHLLYGAVTALLYIPLRSRI